MAFAFCGSFFAQETHWPELNGNMYPFQKPIVAFIQVNGSYIEAGDDWANLEVGAFVFDAELGVEVVRGHQFMDDFTEDGDLFPIIDGMTTYYRNQGEELFFKLYDHATGTLYENFVVFRYGNPTELLTLHTGETHNELYFGEEEAIVLSFTGEEPQGETFTKDIAGYVDTNDNYYLIASPVGDILASNVLRLRSNDYDFYSFTQSMPAEEWQNLKSNDTYEMQIGVGYLYANSEDVTLEFTGTPLDPEEYDEYPIDIVYDAECTTAWKGYNLIGNPYAEPAFLDREYLRLVDGEYELVEDYEEETVDMIEGVFVQAEHADDDTATFNLGWGTEPIIPDGKIVLKVAQGRGLVDRAVILFGEGHQMTKVQFNSSHSKLYIPQDGVDYAMVRSAEMGEMPVNFKAGESGSYMLSIDPKNVEFNYLHLVDNMTGADVDLLANPSYSFEANTTDYASRFKLVFATGANEDSFAFFSNGGFVVSNEGEATLQVIDVNGRILSNETISGSANVHVNAAPGVYMLRLINGDNVKVQKVIVK